jgi:hypothetical protein
VFAPHPRRVMRRCLRCLMGGGSAPGYPYMAQEWRFGRDVDRQCAVRVAYRSPAPARCENMLLKLVELVLADPVDGSTKSITSPAASPTTPEQRSTLSGIGAPRRFDPAAAHNC